MPRSSAIVLLFVACLLPAGALAEAPQAAVDQARSAWVGGWEAYAASLDGTLERPVRAAHMQEAQRLLLAAAAAAPTNPVYAEAAGYVAFQAGDYKTAEQQLTRARERAGNQPRVHMLLAQVYSYGAYDEPKQARHWAKKAVDALTKAGRLDRGNANGQVAAASLLLDAGFSDWRKHLDLALAAPSPALRLYELPLPALPAPQAAAIQYQFCMAQAARLVNVVRACCRWASEHPGEAAQILAQAKQVAGLLQRATPTWASVTLAGVNAERQIEQALPSPSQERLAQLKAWAEALAPLQVMPEPTASLTRFMESQRAAVARVMGAQ